MKKPKFYVRSSYLLIFLFLSAIALPACGQQDTSTKKEEQIDINKFEIEKSTEKEIYVQLRDINNQGILFKEIPAHFKVNDTLQYIIVKPLGAIIYMDYPVDKSHREKINALFPAPYYTMEEFTYLVVKEIE